MNNKEKAYYRKLVKQAKKAAGSQRIFGALYYRRAALRLARFMIKHGGTVVDVKDLRVLHDYIPLNVVTKKYVIIFGDTTTQVVFLDPKEALFVRMLV